MIEGVHLPRCIHPLTQIGRHKRLWLWVGNLLMSSTFLTTRAQHHHHHHHHHHDKHDLPLIWGGNQGTPSGRRPRCALYASRGRGRNRVQPVGSRHCHSRGAKGQKQPRQSSQGGQKRPSARSREARTHCIGETGLDGWGALRFEREEPSGLAV